MVSRKENLQKLRAETFDILVIGGGATGAGIALDAATRGLHVALVEGHDFSSGTSSRSTKLIHGGVRYLERAFTHLDIRQFFLVSQTLKERYTLLRIAPHITRVIPIVIPVYSWFEAAYYMSGIKVYDLLAGKRKVGHSSFLSKKEVMNTFPDIDSTDLKGGVQFFDGQFDDARMNITIILTALKHGATAANYVEVIGFEREGGRINRALLRDNLSGETFSVKSKVFVNATGPLSYKTRKLDNPEVKQVVGGSVGTHILLEGKYTPFDKGLLIPRTADGRILFLLPWKGFTLVGTTDVPIKISEDPKPSREEIHYLIDHLKNQLGIEISESQIKASWAGIRPLVSIDKGETSKVFRGFKIIRDPSGLYSLMGGKWTAYRKMAEKFLDELVGGEELEGVRPCVTENTMLLGGEEYSPKLAESLSEEFGLDEDITQHLAQSYGDKAIDVIKLAETVDQSGRIVEKYPYLLGEIIYAVRNEMACTPLDFLYRRTRLAALDQESAISAIPKVVELMAKELDWNTVVQQEEFVKTRQRIKNI